MICTHRALMLKQPTVVAFFCRSVLTTSGNDGGRGQVMSTVDRRLLMHTQRIEQPALCTARWAIWRDGVVPLSALAATDSRTNMHIISIGYRMHTCQHL